MRTGSSSRRGTLVAASLGFVVVLLDVSVVNVALDALLREFRTDVAGLQWVVNAYTLVFAALLLSSGALGDRFGPRRIYLGGLALFTAASVACGAAPGLGLLLALAAGGAFVRIEARSAAPMLPLGLLRIRAFAIASLCGVVVNFGYYGLVFVFSLFFQVQQHLSPQQTGLAFLPMTLVLMGASVLAGRLVTRIGARRLMVMGLGLAACGYALLLPVRIEGAYAWLVLPMLLAASGTALCVPTMTNLALSSVEASRAGIASGVLNASRQVGGLLGVAVFGHLVRHTAPQAFLRGMQLSTGIAAVLLLLGCALCWWRLEPLPRGR
ncbi:MFS transporter [Variovorax paradoxus]|uniref:MFS transporter n=1 Tax=Variovorax paradoxus TaxID=34073 RepID=UPI001ABC5926